MIPIHHLVFDIGSVLIHYDPTIPFKRLIPDQQERNWFFNNVCTSAWNIEQDRGRSWQDAEALLIGQYPGQAENIRAFRENWRQMVPHSYDGSVEIMVGLIDRGKDVTMLTNFASDTFLEANELFPFLKLPRGVTVSGEVKLIKPDPAIYELHQKQFGLDPVHTLFIDDNLANVEAAKSAGWQAIHFTSPENLAMELNGYEIL